jgi:transcriptional regulator with GAF, ATPase, and Fis domain
MQFDSRRRDGFEHRSSARILKASTPIALRYEALFRVSDCLREHRTLEELLRTLPCHLRPVVDFGYLSLLLVKDPGKEASWYVGNDEDPLTLALVRNLPAEHVCLSWALEHQQSAVIPEPGGEISFPGSQRWLTDRGLQAGYAIPLSTVDRQLGAIFLAREYVACCQEEEVRFLSTVAHRIALALEDLLKQESGSHCIETLALREEIAATSMFEEIVGSSKALDRVLTQVKRVAPKDATVLITGETGTGKELIARAIHKRSHRSHRPFVRVNCAAIPPTLIASELFGYEKGAFTGASQRHLGRFELANGGTIFLDEIGDIPAEAQVALLRVLQEREFERVGGTHAIPIDVRVIAATNCDLKAAVKAGTFRLDLFYRLDVFPIQIPSLRERPEDILLLAEYFIDRYASKVGKKIRNIGRNTLEWLQAYDWPGNIRELQNVMERAVILCDTETLSIDETWLQPEARTPSEPAVSLVATLVNQEREMIETAIEESRGRISGPFGAAVKLGMPRTTLESKIKSLRINKHQFKQA